MDHQRSSEVRQLRLLVVAQLTQQVVVVAVAQAYAARRVERAEDSERGPILCEKESAPSYLGPESFVQSAAIPQLTSLRALPRI